MSCGSIVAPTQNPWAFRRPFAREIRRSLPWLFDEYGAQEIPNTRKYPKAFDYVVVTITAEKVLFAFIRGRGELQIGIAPEHAPNDWQEIGEVIADLEGLKEPPRYYQLQGFGLILKQHLDRISRALSKAEYGGPRRDRSTIRLIPL